MTFPFVPSFLSSSPPLNPSPKKKNSDFQVDSLILTQGDPMCITVALCSTGFQCLIFRKHITKAFLPTCLWMTRTTNILISR